MQGYTRGYSLTDYGHVWCKIAIYDAPGIPRPESLLINVSLTSSCSNGGGALDARYTGFRLETFLSENGTILCGGEKVLIRMKI